MFERVKSLARRPRKKRDNDLPSQRRSYPHSSTGLYGVRFGSYDNNYPNISTIANQFMKVLPFAIDENGERLKETPPAVAALYRPNREMGVARFLETLAVLAMVHPQVYLLVWRKNGAEEPIDEGEVTADNIAGYTFLQNVKRMWQGDKYVFISDSGKTYDDFEVITISYGVNPYDVNIGYSPSLSAKKWANIDDYVADYQAGHFLNGAMPAGQFVIATKTVEEYDEIVDEIIKRHQGVGKNGNVTFSHRPIDPATGVPMPAQIEWVPFNTSNRDLALQEIFDQANKKLDLAFHVPAEINGYISNSNYASANTASAYFGEYVVDPLLMKIWSQFTSELNRITGGLGYAISYDYEIPKSADEERTKAATTQIQLYNLDYMLRLGYSTDAAVDSLGLPEVFKGLKRPSQSSEVEKAVQKAVKPSKSKLLLGADELNPQLEEAIEAQMLAQINAVIDGKEEDREAKAEKLAQAMLDILLARMLMTGTAQTEQGKLLLMTSGVGIDSVGDYLVSAQVRDSYASYLKEVALSYDDDTAVSIKRVLERAAVEGWDKEMTATELRGIMDTDEWRVQRLATSETHRADGLARLDAMKQVQDDTGVQFAKQWHRNPSSDSCDNCRELDGRVMPLDDAFVRDGGLMPSGMTNDFVSIEAADAHPNCHCYLTFIITSTPEKSVKVNCPKCGRFVCDAKNGRVEKVICGDSRCKCNFSFTVANGNIETKIIGKELKNDDKRTQNAK